MYSHAKQLQGVDEFRHLITPWGINILVTQNTKFAITPQEKKRFKIISFLEQSKYNELSYGSCLKFCKIRDRKG